MDRLARPALIALLLAAAVAVPAAAQEPAEEPAAATEAADGFASELERSSYALGFSVGQSFHDSGVELAVDQVLAGMEEGLAGEEGRLSRDEVVVLTQKMRNRMMRLERERVEAEAAENRAAGEAFLAENRERPGVVTTDSGLQYEVLEEGEGPSPAVDDTVRVHYRGTLLDGTEFDSSRARGQAAVIQPDRVIPAWTEALPMMSVGGKWKLFVRPELAFGAMGSGSNIPPGATLIYEIELLGIEGGSGDD